MIRSKFWSGVTAHAFLGTLVLGFAGTTAAEDPIKPIRALLVIGGCCHDYAKQKDLLTRAKRLIESCPCASGFGMPST